jgi:hypothetical protein
MTLTYSPLLSLELWLSGESDAVSLVFDSVRQGLASTNHPNLASTALTCLVVLIKRMALQDSSRLKAVAPSILPLLVDRLGDVKDRYRDLAMNSLVEFWKACPSDVEKTIKEVGFGNKSWRIREQVPIFPPPLLIVFSGVLIVRRV